MLTAEWEDDCNGKKDFDAPIVGLSCRYWPRGGGHRVLTADGRWEGNESRPEIKPSARASIIVDDETTVCSASFEGETESEVKAAVEKWAAKQHARVVRAIAAEFEDDAVRGAKEANK